MRVGPCGPDAATMHEETTMNDTRRHWLSWMAAAAAAAAMPTAHAQTQTRALVGFPPGGAIDQTARAIAERARGEIGTIVVENRPGAAGNIAAAALAHSAPDGQT